MICGHRPIGSLLKDESIFCQLEEHGHEIAHEHMSESKLLYLWIEDKYIQTIDARGHEKEWGEVSLTKYK